MIIYSRIPFGRNSNSIWILYSKYVQLLRKAETFLMMQLGLNVNISGCLIQELGLLLHFSLLSTHTEYSDNVCF